MPENETEAHKLSHGVKNYLAIVCSMVDVILMDEESLDAGVIEYLREIQKSVQLCLPLMSKLQQLADANS